MLMSAVKMPRYDMYWSQETRFEPITSTLSLKRYKKTPEFLHVVDNSEKEKEENKGDKCFKVKPLLRAVTNNYIKIQSIDEPIIPAKTKKVAD